jgi:putative Ca2+/H+ antiporter (TMEM165/GDT1 family)
VKLSSEPFSLPTLERHSLSASHQSSEPEQKRGNNYSCPVANFEKAQPVLGVSQNTQQQHADRRNRGVGEIFGSTFLTIFLAEFGDKTQLSTLLMSAESQSPWVVFAGAAAALVTTSLLGVLLGQWLANRLEPKTVETAAGASLLLISVMLLWDVAQF